MVWYAVVVFDIAPIIAASCSNVLDSNWRPQSLVMCSGQPNFAMSAVYMSLKCYPGLVTAQASGRQS